MALCARCVAVPTWLKPYTFKKFDWNWWRSVSFKECWLIVEVDVSRGEQDGLPLFNTTAGENSDVADRGMLLFIPLCNKSHMFLLFQTSPCYFELWRNIVGYVTQDVYSYSSKSAKYNDIVQLKKRTNNQFYIYMIYGC